MRFPSTLLIPFVVVLLSSSVGLQAQSKADRIDALMEKYLEYGQFNGSLLVAEGGRLLLKKGYGYANFEWEIPCAPDTKFRIGSITKQFTSMLIMRHVEKGEIGLDDPLMKYLPAYPKEQGKVTVRHLLNHTSGIPSYTGIMDIRSNRSFYPLDSLIAVFSARPLEFDPGTRYRYNNSGYVLLGAILEKVTGRSYEQLLREEILEPLGMENTGYDHAEPIITRRAAGYDRTGGLRNTQFVDMSLPYAAGAMYSTVEDLFRWDRALYADRLISEKSKAEYFKPGLNGYAFGWVIGTIRLGRSADSVETISHGGGINGFSTLIVRIPAQQHLIVLFNNTGPVPLHEIATAIAGILYEKPYAEPRRSLATALDGLIEKSGVAEAVASFAELKERKAEYYLDEAEINALGYRLMQGGNVKAAIDVFKLNVQEFPGSWNVYDSLGEAFMADGQRALAIANYEKSVALNPANTGGREALERLKGEKAK
jgi:CubicO group peptidase (beta-lactamase class C family)